MPQVAFTKAVIDSLPSPAKGSRSYQDPKTPGLEILITAQGAKTFYTRKRVAGANRIERVKIGRWPTITVDAARRIALGNAAALEEGRSVIAEKKAKRVSELTLREALDAFKKFKFGAGGKESTTRWYEDTIVAHAGGWIDRRLADLTDEEFQRLYERARVVRTEERTSKKGRIFKASRGGEAVARSFGRALRGVINFAIESNISADGRPLLSSGVPMACRKLRVSRVARREGLIPEHLLGAWLKALSAEPTLTAAMRDYLELLLFTGLRSGEGAALEIEHVNLEASVLSVRETKNGRPHTLPVGPHIKALLSRRIADARALKSSWVFPARAGEGHLTTSGRALGKVGAAIGLPRLTPHDMRRTFACAADSAGIGAFTLKRLLNHISGDVTFGYVPGSDVERLRAPMLKVEAMILSYRASGMAEA